jgi:hypothetical protein
MITTAHQRTGNFRPRLDCEFIQWLFFSEKGNAFCWKKAEFNIPSESKVIRAAIQQGIQKRLFHFNSE